MSGVSLFELNFKKGCLCPSPGQSDQVTRPVYAGQIIITSAGELNTMAPLSATKIKYVVIPLNAEGSDNPVNFMSGDVIIFYDIPVCAKVNSIKQGSPPINGKVPVLNQAEGQGCVEADFFYEVLASDVSGQ